MSREINSRARNKKTDVGIREKLVSDLRKGVSPASFIYRAFSIVGNNSSAAHH